jgi:hypothetical protein
MGRLEGPHEAGGPAASGAALHDVGKGGRGRSVTVHEHPRETGGSLGKALRSRKSISVGEPSGAGGRHDHDFRFWRFFFSQPVKNITPLRSLHVSV